MTTAFVVFLLLICVHLTQSQLEPIPFDNACRIEDSNDKTLVENNCTACGKCSLGPFRGENYNIPVKAFFCHYYRSVADLYKEACLVEDAADNSTITQRPCHNTIECSLGPLEMKLPNDTDARLYFCQRDNQTRPDSQEGRPPPPGGEPPRREGRRPPPQSGEREGRPRHDGLPPPRGMPPPGRKPPPGWVLPNGGIPPRREGSFKSDVDKEGKVPGDMFQILIQHACYIFNITSNLQVSTMDCCNNCTDGPVTITTEDAKLRLLFCSDHIEDDHSWMEGYRESREQKRQGPRPGKPDIDSHPEQQGDSLTPSSWIARNPEIKSETPMPWIRRTTTP